MGAISDKRDSDNDPIFNFMPFLTKPYYVGTARVALAESLMFFHCCCVIGNGDDDEIFTSDFPRNFYMAYGIARDTEMRIVLIFFYLMHHYWHY